VGEIKGVSKTRYLVWSNENREIFAGNQAGKITVWDPVKGSSLYVHEAHENAITKMQWFEKSRYLMTASKEKVLNIWQVPKTWISEGMPEEEKVDDEDRFNEKKLKNILEEQKLEEEAATYEPFEDNFVEHDNRNAFNNIAQGFDPLGGGQTNITKKVKTDDDDLMGWHK
jgi:WD40 repeat protein